ncbi:MAG TPA: FmdB family zinc ribbon protein [bacterium]|nr:FmdB family zinc ribbon protein [bacterium]
MPIYEYRCTKCGHQFEVTHAVAEAVERCERCGAPVRRVFSPVGIIFKGAGFHVNDYRKTPAPAEGDGKSASPSKQSSPSKESPTPSATAPAAGSGSAASTTSAGTKSS